MKREVYRKVVKEIEKEDWDFDQVLEILREKFPFEHSASLRSILHQEYQKRVKRKHKEFNSEEGRKKIVQDFKKAVNSKDYSRKVAKIHKKSCHSVEKQEIHSLTRKDFIESTIQ